MALIQVAGASDLPGPLAGYKVSRSERIAYLPVVMSLEPGHGHVSALLRQLQSEHDQVVVPCVMSRRLVQMLQRRGFHRESHWVDMVGEYDDNVWVWRRPEDVC